MNVLCFSHTPAHGPVTNCTKLILSQYGHSSVQMQTFVLEGFMFPPEKLNMPKWQRKGGSDIQQMAYSALIPSAVICRAAEI